VNRSFQVEMKFHNQTFPTRFLRINDAVDHPHIPDFWKSAYRAKTLAELEGTIQNSRRSTQSPDRRAGLFYCKELALSESPAGARGSQL
jgi:hypothetical protein